MSFDLKNGRATYQRFMDRILLLMLGRNVQAYVDDMVVILEKEKVHVSDLEELFATIGKHDLKLNPEKLSSAYRQASSSVSYELKGESRQILTNAQQSWR